MHHPLHRSLKAAYSFYNVHTQTPLLDLMNDSLILAKMVMTFWIFVVHEEPQVVRQSFIASRISKWFNGFVQQK